MGTLKEVCAEMWQVDSGLPGPRVTILGGVHGNERSGIAIVQNLLKRDLASLVVRGMLTIGIGNPAAVEASERYVPGDFDLNRSFGDLPGDHKNSIAAQRASELKPILAATDVLIDLNATIKPSRPFILSPNDANDPLLQKLLPYFGIPTVITGKALGEDATGVTTDLFVCQNGGLAFTIESGGIEDVTLVSGLERATIKALEVIGLAGSTPFQVIPISIDYFDAYWSVPASEAFRFTNTWEAFAFLPKDTHFATDYGEKLVTPCDSYMIFQKPPELLKNGTEACLLLRKS